MKGNSVERILFAAGSFILGVLSWVFALSLLPTMAEAQEKGTFIPLLVTWAMVWLTTLAALALVVFLIALGKRPSLIGFKQSSE